MKERPRISFKENLRRLMSERSISARHLSGGTGIPIKTIYHWLSGQLPRKPEHLLAVSKFFEVSMECILFEKNDGINSALTLLPSSKGQAMTIQSVNNDITLKIQVIVEKADLG